MLDNIFGGFSPPTHRAPPPPAMAVHAGLPGGALVHGAWRAAAASAAGELTHGTQAGRRAAAAWRDGGGLGEGLGAARE
jgi:hypothetical protein